MSLPVNLKFAPTHEWCLKNADGTFSVGITEFAQEALGDIIFLKLPQLGQTVLAQQPCAVVESVKSASDIHSPITGEVIAIHDALISTPEEMNADPYGSWLFTVQVADHFEADLLLDAKQYGALIGL